MASGEYDVYGTFPESPEHPSALETHLFAVARKDVRIYIYIYIPTRPDRRRSSRIAAPLVLDGQPEFNCFWEYIYIHVYVCVYACARRYDYYCFQRYTPTRAILKRETSLVEKTSLLFYYHILLLYIRGARASPSSTCCCTRRGARDRFVRFSGVAFFRFSAANILVVGENTEFFQDVTFFPAVNIKHFTNEPRVFFGTMRMFVFRNII